MLLNLPNFARLLPLLPAVTMAADPGTSPSPAPTGEDPPDKSSYHLFNRTPRAYLRPLSTDRPDRTESAYTVDAGWFQVEMDLFSYSRDHDTRGDSDVTVESWAVTPVNLKLGLANWMDFQTVIETYNHVTIRDRVAGTKTRQSGVGDVVNRMKINLWGNDGGSTAMALMPLVKWPSNQDDLGNNSVEGGLIIPLAIQLPGDFGLGVMTEFDVNRDENGRGYHLDFINSITVSHSIIGPVSGYIEFFSAANSPWVGTLDIGITCAIGENLQLDAGVNIGVTESADDINPFLGLSFRM